MSRSLARHRCGSRTFGVLGAHPRSAWAWTQINPHPDTLADGSPTRYLLRMLDARGLVTYVVTYHQHILVMALVVASITTAPFVLFSVRSRTGLERAYLSATMFIGTLLFAHVGFSWVFGHDALDVETIRLEATKDDAGLVPTKKTNKSLTPKPITPP